MQWKTFMPTNNYDLSYLRQWKSNPSLSLLVKSLTLKDPIISESCIEIKIEWNVYFHTSLWCLKRFYESLLLSYGNHSVDLLSGTTKKCKNSFYFNATFGNARRVGRVTNWCSSKIKLYAKGQILSCTCYCQQIS